MQKDVNRIEQAAQNVTNAEVRRMQLEDLEEAKQEIMELQQKCIKLVEDWEKHVATVPRTKKQSEEQCFQNWMEKNNRDDMGIEQIQRMLKVMERKLKATRQRIASVPVSPREQENHLLVAQSSRDLVTARSNTLSTSSSHCTNTTQLPSTSMAKVHQQQLFRSTSNSTVCSNQFQNYFGWNGGPSPMDPIYYHPMIAQAPIPPPAPDMINAKAVQLLLLNSTLQGIPKFDGDGTKWSQWWNNFNVRVHQTTLSNTEKMQFLTQLLSGEPLKLASNFTISEESYNVVLEKLKSRYGKQSDIEQSLAKTLMKMKPVSEDSYMEIQTKVDEIESIYLQMKSLGLDTESKFFQNTVIEKFPFKMQAKLRVIQEEGKPTKDLLKAMNKTVQLLKYEQEAQAEYQEKTIRHNHNRFAFFVMNHTGGSNVKHIQHRKQENEN
uniref:Uncharacterized protein n=1 Tax=Panagrolaimus sp. JU765 TaxID=591449 RepID=A0AC34RHN5_9BILA